MFKNKNTDGSNNICGKKIAVLRKSAIPKMSQRLLADKMQLQGIDIDKNAVQRIESGQRFVTDIEIVALSEIFAVSCDELLKNSI
jgi:UDP-N-acetyl-D-mannosaminuronate dehydrogenase